MARNKPQVNISPEELKENYSKAVELAGLVGCYFSRSRKDNDIKELATALQGLSTEDNIMLKHLKTGTLRKVKKAASDTVEALTATNKDSTSSHSSSLEMLLSEDFSDSAITRIRELYSIPGVQELYFQELEKRQGDFELLQDGYRQLPKVQLQDDLMRKAHDKILDIEVKAFTERRGLTPAEKSLVKRLEEGMEDTQKDKATMLQSRELATAYRKNELEGYRKQLDTGGYVMLPSRREIVEEIQRKLLLGHNILLNGPTGTGKTALAMEAIRELGEKMKIGFEEIKGKGLAEETKDMKQLDDFIEVLSGHSGITPSEFIAKTQLKGNIETKTQLGKVLKAFVEGKIPIIDEIDLIPNDVLMRIKHLFALRPGKLYAPQEDGNEKHRLLTTSIIATANLKSEKHQDREDLDPAIARLFTGVYVGYLPKGELLDFALVKLMRPQGYIEYVGEKSLSDKNKGVLPLLVQACKDIEDNYMGVGAGETINNKNKQFLKKSVLEMGQFSKMLDGYHGNPDFNTFIVNKVIDFVASATEKNDKLILIKIFSAKGLLAKVHAQKLSTKTGLPQADIDTNILSSELSLVHDENAFIDPYQLANIDPYGKRKLSQLAATDNKKMLVNALQFCMSELMTLSELDMENCIEITEKILQNVEKGEKADEHTESLMDALLHMLGQATTDEEKNVILVVLSRLKSLGGSREKIYQLHQETIDAIIASMQVKPVTTKPIESNEQGTTALKQYIMIRNKATIDRLQQDGKVEIEGGIVASNLNITQINAIQAITDNDVIVKASESKDITIGAITESIVLQDIEVRGMAYRAIQIPPSLKTKKLSELEMGRRLLENKNNDWFVGMDFNTTVGEALGDWIVWEKSNRKDAAGTPRVNIQTYNASQETDVLRECLKDGKKPISIAQSLLLGEIVKYGLGDEYIDFLAYKADGDETGHQEIRKKIQTIDNYLGMSFGEYNASGYIIRNWGLYINKKGNPNAFVRGAGAGFGCLGGVASLRLYWDVDRSYGYIGFRSCL